MKEFLGVLFIFVCLVSCDNRIYYYLDEVSNDTIASCLYSKGEDIHDTKFVIIVRDSIYGEEKVDNLLKKLGVIPEMSNAAKGRQTEKMLSPHFYLYFKKGSFSDFNEGFYNDTNFYLEGKLYYYEWGKLRNYDNYRIRLYENKYQLTSSIDLKKEKEDFINAFLRDSVRQVYSRLYKKLSFMDYKLGGPFYKKRNSGQYSILKSGQTIQGEEIDDIEISHYDNIIYKIEVYIKDHIKGIHSYQLDNILDLYREKYGNNYGGKEWVFSNSSIKIETKLQTFSIGENGELVRRKHRGMPQRDVITEIIITYHDHEIDSILKVKRQKDEIIEKKRLEKEEKHKHKQLLNNI